jgi:endonuclease G
VTQQDPARPHGPPPPGEPAPTRPSPGPPTAAPLVAAAEVQAALATLAQAPQRPYYDAAADRANQTTYYQPIPTDLTPTQRAQALSGLVRATHTTTPRYRPMVELYPWVDLHPDLALHTIYADTVLDPAQLIVEDFGIEAQRTARLATAAHELDAIEADLPFNCEHVVPQSWFAKAEPMRGDLHHLFACEPRCNSFRGNTAYFDFADYPHQDVIRDDCGRCEPDRFEPQAGKGPAARATLYFLLRYPGLVDPDELPTEQLTVLLDWHEQFPVGDYERHRNAAVFARQGNRNPLIDHPEWASGIDFSARLTGDHN